MKHSGLQWVAGSGTPKKVYIGRVFNFGTWKEWKEMKKRFALREIRDAVKNPLPGEWTPRGRALAETIFDCRMPKKALISYRA